MRCAGSRSTPPTLTSNRRRDWWRRGMSPAAHGRPLVQAAQRDPGLDQEVVCEQALGDFEPSLWECLQDRSYRTSDVGFAVGTELDRHLLEGAEHGQRGRTTASDPVVRSGLGDPQEHDLDAHPHHADARRRPRGGWPAEPHSSRMHHHFAWPAGGDLQVQVERVWIRALRSDSSRWGISSVLPSSISPVTCRILEDTAVFRAAFHLLILGTASPDM